MCRQHAAELDDLRRQVDKLRQENDKLRRVLRAVKDAAERFDAAATQAMAGGGLGHGEFGQMRGQQAAAREIGAIVGAEPAHQPFRLRGFGGW